MARASISTPAASGEAKRDKNFQGFGRFLTGSTGEYYFRTIKPVAYPGRTPHIHFAVKMKGREKWTTQCYIKGEPQNEKDGVLRGIKDDKVRESVIVDFAAHQGVEDRRAGGEIRHRHGLYADGRWALRNNLQGWGEPAESQSPL